ncbi:MAG: hypothetical protein J6E46_03825 [Faecalicoccus sp.]|nr:hypothetical protein [Faecalicoccus sp.]
MSDRKYLNENQHQRSVRKLSLISKIMMIIGGLGFLGCGFMLFGHFIDYNKVPLIGFGWILCGGLFGVGLVLAVMANSRKIMSYNLQESLPVIKEGMEEITPMVDKMADQMSPSLKKAAKDIAEGVKEGMEE